MKKKHILIILLITFTLLTGCTQEPEQNLNCGEHKNNETWKINCNTCQCNNGEISCTTIKCPEPINESLNNQPTERQLEQRYNTNLTDYEQKWMSYVENKYPDNKIYLIKSDKINCVDCYELYFKKGQEIVKIKVLDNELIQETLIKNDLVPLIENEEICSLFGGKWNECPRPCTTDEEACTAMCSPPICEFEENKVTYKVKGEECGGFNKGICEYGLNCYYQNPNDKYGICK